MRQRLRFVYSKAILFEEFFARRCKPAIWCDEQGELEEVCYMWWDLGRDAIPDWSGPIIGDQAPPDWRIALAILRTLRRILAVPHDACRSSALHGLGHWQEQAPLSVARIVDNFLADNPVMRPELR